MTYKFTDTVAASYFALAFPTSIEMFEDSVSDGLA
jgi:hypothetical protein